MKLGHSKKEVTKIMFSYGLKKCSRCEDWKNLDEFDNSNLNYITSKRSRCKKCNNEPPRKKIKLKPGAFDTDTKKVVDRINEFYKFLKQF